MAFKMRGFSPFTKQGETFDQAFRGAKNAGVRYFYWKDKKYTTRLKEEVVSSVKVGLDRV